MFPIPGYLIPSVQALNMCSNIRQRKARLFNRLREIAHYLGISCLFFRHPLFDPYTEIRGFPPFLSLAHPLQYIGQEGAVSLLGSVPKHIGLGAAKHRVLTEGKPCA